MFLVDLLKLSSSGQAATYVPHTFSRTPTSLLLSKDFLGLPEVNWVINLGSTALLVPEGLAGRARKLPTMQYL
jgi:hypothetical protein